MGICGSSKRGDKEKTAKYADGEDNNLLGDSTVDRNSKPSGKGKFQDSETPVSCG